MNERVPDWAPWVAGLAVVLQSHFAHRLGWAGEFCDLSMAVAMACALAAGVETGLVTGLVSGVLMGYTAGMALPAFIASRVLVAAGVGRMRFVVHGGNPLAQMGIAAVGGLGAELIFVVGYPAVLGHPDWLDRVLFRAGLTAIVTPVVAWLVSYLPLPEERLA